MADETEDNKPNQVPPVPPQTYRWEEVRKQKLQGAYPWTHLFKPPFDNATWEKERDHEYEPINPMASQRSPPPVMQVTDTEAAPASTKQQKKGPSARITYIDNDPNFIHIPLHGSDEDVADAPPLSYLQIPSDDKIVVSQDADADADIEDAQEFEDEDLSAQEIQNRMEERFFAHSPTTESRTDCEINTSQIDSSALEDLPLKREARKAGASDSKSGFQQKIKSQAGRLRTKFKNLSKPKISLPDRPKFNLPDRPKFNLPDRPKFKMPERPKINLPDRPKFNFPDRPKFNLPDRPKFNMPQRPKISMPNFNLTKPRTSSSLRRPLRDRNQYHSSAQTTYGGKKNIFDTLNFRTYPRFFNKKKRIAEENARIRGRAMTPPPRMETDSIPSSPGSSKVPHTQTWGQKYRDIKFVDDENQSDKMSASLKAMSSFDDEVEDDMAEFRDQDFNGATSLDETKRKLKAISASSIQDSEKEQRSSGSSSDRHRKGVLEEIDSDEFFLREKGLSREDVDVSRYLSLEIRDAFRSPQNALARMDTDPFDDEICEAEEDLKKLTSVIQDTFKPEEYEEEEEVEEFEPKRPSRSRSLKSKQSTHSRSSLGRESLPEERENYKTYPPVRPSRKQSADKQSITTADIKDLDLDNESNESNEMNQVDLERVSIPNFEQQSFITQSTNETWAQAGQPPLPPKRRKSQKSLNKDSESMIDEVCPDDDWLDEVNAQLMVPGEITALQIETKAPTINIEQPTYDSPPIAPLRKSRSRATSLADEDRTSRGCDSLISEARSMPGDEFPVRRILSKEDDGNDMFGYATVEKTPVSKILERPQRQKKNNKPNRPPPPNRFNKKKATTQMMNLKNQGIHLKNQGINFFFTYPRRAMKSLNKDQQPPVRPVRNYSTIGPSRPPRRTKVFKEPVYAEGDNIPFMDESEKETIESSTPKIQHMAEDEDDKPLKDIIVEDLKDLQSGDVIEKMKGRPLPAPPRPPRKSKTEDQLKESMNLADDEVCDFDDDEIVVSEKIDIQITKTPEAGRSRTDIDVQEPEPGVDDTEPTTVQVEEVCTRVEEVVTTTAQVNKGQKQKEDNKTSPGKEVVQEKVEVEKKEGPFAAFKEMISQKKREFFEPKKDKETSPTKQESSEQKTKVSREKSPIFKFIPLRSGSGQVEPQVEEANVSTQTDPLPEGYTVEEEQQTTTEENRTVSTSPPPSVSELKTDSVTNQQAPVQIQTVIEKRVVVAPDEDTEVSFLKAKKLQVSELDVEKINVSELQANKISVSNIDGVSMQLSEISSKAGNLIVNGVELPPEFLQSLRQAASSQEGQTTGTTNVVSQPQSSETTDVPSLKIPPADSTQPPPVVVYPSQTPIIIYPPQMNSGSGPVTQQTISVHPAHITPFYGSGFEAASPTTTPLPRTRSPPRDLAPDTGSLLPVVKSSSAEEATNPRPILPGSVDRPSAAHLTHELMLIGRDTLGDIISQIITGLNHYFPDGEKRRDAQTAVCIVLVLIAGLMLLGLGGEDKAVHHHHWDFFPPPR
ncbi:uncharacterized protein LOC111046879 isoform X2 [Nilaparvata lugens]|uniref:uncharacterized protein LOC111046879 isoform X2 n=1 Tax=Nilaparvata lugens TaxID=108931 RepID=UPI00193CC615|nr:uncharacterized protein LOC111046879 isoform X2 [Nilaparvata lugens]